MNENFTNRIINLRPDYIETYWYYDKRLLCEKNKVIVCKIFGNYTSLSIEGLVSSYLEREGVDK